MGSLLKRLLGGAGSVRLAPSEAWEKVSSGEAVVVDVREKGEWRAGKVPGARHIPLGELEGKLGRLPKDRELVMICRSGSRSRIACRRAASMGYEAVDVKGGARAWVREGLPFKGRVA